MPNENVELWAEVREQAFQECMDLSEALIASQLGIDGEAPGDQPIDRPGRIERFVDLAQRNVLDILEVRSPTVFKKMMDQYVKDITDSPLVSEPDSAEQDWFGLDSKPPDEVETEPTFACDPEKLPPLPRPWLLIQGYRDQEHSLRLIPARQIAYARIKRPGMMARERAKTSAPVDYGEASQAMATLPRIAVKERYLIRDEMGRAWLVDHILSGGGAWICETELQELSAADQQITPPPFAGQDLTLSPQGYTYSFAQPMSHAKLVIAIADAARGGSTEAYAPSETRPGFQWVSKGAA